MSAVPGEFMGLKPGVLTHFNRCSQISFYKSMANSISLSCQFVYDNKHCCSLGLKRDTIAWLVQDWEQFGDICCRTGYASLLKAWWNILVLSPYLLTVFPAVYSADPCYISLWEIVPYSSVHANLFLLHFPALNSVFCWSTLCHNNTSRRKNPC